MTTDILDIDESDPRKIVIEIDKAIRPEPGSGEKRIKSYADALEHAYAQFGLELPFALPQNIVYSNASDVYADLTTAIEKLKIDVLRERFERETVVSLDETWRDKIHTYLQHIRRIVEQTDIDVGLRDRILASLNSLAGEIDRSRAPLQKFTDTLVQLCEGVSEGADALNPAIKLFERIVGAVVRLKTAGKPQLALPKPEDFGLDKPPQIEDKTDQ